MQHLIMDLYQFTHSSSGKQKLSKQKQHWPESEALSTPMLI